MEIEIKTKEKDVFVVRESLLESVVKDIVSFGVMVLLIFVNHRYGGKSTFVDAFGIFCLMLFFIKTARKDQIKNIDEAIKYFQDLKNSTEK